MHIVIGLAAVLQIACAFLVLGGAESAIHEILAALLFGFGILCFALALISWQIGQIAGRASSFASSLASKNRGADVVSVYKGREIIKTASGFQVGTHSFPGMLAAEKFIDGLAQ